MVALTKLRPMTIWYSILITFPIQKNQILIMKKNFSIKCRFTSESTFSLLCNLLTLCEKTEYWMNKFCSINKVCGGEWLLLVSIYKINRPTFVWRLSLNKIPYEPMDDHSIPMQCMHVAELLIWKLQKN